MPKSALTKIIAGSIFLNGIIILTETFAERFSQRFDMLDNLVPFGVHYTSRIITVSIGAALIYISFNLLRRKKTAFFITILLLSLDILTHLNLRRFFTQPLTSFIILALLLVNAKKYTVKSEPQSITRGFIYMTGAAIFAIAYGTIGFWFLDPRDFRINFLFRDAFLNTISQFALIGDSNLIPYTRNAKWFLDSLNAIGLVSAAFAVYNLFRPVAFKFVTLPHEKQQAAQIVEKWGESDLDFFKLMGDKNYFFSEDKSSFITYKTVRGIAICLGDPLGPNSKIAKLISDFSEYCDGLGWQIIFVSTSQKNLPTFKRLKFNKLKIGEEAIISLDYFFQQTIKKEDFGRISRKFDKEGFKTEILPPPHDSDIISELTEVSRQWLAQPGRKEFSFFTGKFETDYISKTPVFIVKNPTGQIIAFTNFIPSYQKDLATIDLMRHLKVTPNGTMDFLFTKLFLTLKNQGYRKFNLGLVPLSGSSGKKDIYERQLIRLVINRFFSFKGLRKYKEKFDPTWESRFLIYKGPITNILPISLAITKIIND